MRDTLADATETLIEAQATDTARFTTIVADALAAIRRLTFPLGSPARGYDLVDIDAMLVEWLTPRSERDLADLARDAANDNSGPDGWRGLEA